MYSWKTESKGLQPQRINRVMMPVGSKIIGVFSQPNGASITYIYKNKAKPDPKELRIIALYAVNENSTEAKDGEDIIPIGMVQVFGRYYSVFEITGTIDE